MPRIDQIILKLKLRTQPLKHAKTHKDHITHSYEHNRKLTSRCPGVEDGWLPGQRLTKISFKGSVEFDDDFDSYCDSGTVSDRSDPCAPSRSRAFDMTNNTQRSSAQLQNTVHKRFTY